MSAIPTHLFLLGRPHAERDGHAAEPLPAKGLALLAYLALTGHSQRRDHLLELLWADSWPEAARKNLRNTLWALRRALGEEIVQTDGDRLALPQSLWVDALAFQQLAGAHSQDGTSGSDPAQRAVDLYMGPLLDGLDVDGAPEWELWLTTERERLGQEATRLLGALVAAHRAVGNWQGMIETARRALALDNLQEPMYQALMEAHARLGQRPEALRQYEALRSVMEQELGVEPLPESKALAQTIVSGELAPLPHPLTSLPPPRSPRRSPSLAGQGATPFVGREAELGALNAALSTVISANRAHVLLLSGEVGMGKTRLWQEWTSRLEAPVTVLEGRSVAAMQTLPFAPLSELLASPAVSGRLFRPGSPVPTLWLAEVARLLPDLRQGLPDLPAPAALPADEERHRLFEALVHCLRALMESGAGPTPLLLFLDDLHWADSATLEWLGYLLHRLREWPLLFVAAYRSEEAPAALVRLLAGWSREGIVTRVPLARLTEPEAEALLARLGGDPTLAIQAQRQSAGNPYFLIELWRAAVEATAAGLDQPPVPPVLGELIRARLERLPDTARQVLQAAAVLYPEWDLATLRRTSGRSEEETLDALDALLDGAVLTEQPERSHGPLYRFTHPLVASVIATGLSSARRHFLHRRAAEALETQSSNLPALAGRLAHHHAEAGNPARAADYADIAAHHALSLASPTEAIAWYRRALELAPTPERQLGLARASERGNDVAATRAAYEAALRSYEVARNGIGIARASLGLAFTGMLSGRADEVLRWANASRRALDHQSAEAHPDLHAQTHFALGAASIQAGLSLNEAERHLSEAFELATTYELPNVAATARFELGNLYAERGNLRAAVAAYRDSIGFAQAAGDPSQEVLGHNNAAYHSMLAGDLPAAHTHIAAALALTEANDLVFPCQYLFSTRAEIALAEQAWDEAEGWLRRALAEAERTGNAKQVANTYLNLGLAARGRGDLDGALLLLEQANDLLVRLTAPHLRPQLDLALADLFLARGEHAAAHAALEAAEQVLTGSQYGRLKAQAATLRQRLSGP